MDVGGEAIHCVAIDGHGKVRDSALLPTRNIELITGWATPADCVAVDAPEALSTEPHIGDSTLPVKFRTARCAEVDLRARYGMAVPWTTPTANAPKWMEVGFRLFDLLKELGSSPLRSIHTRGSYDWLAASHCQRRHLPQVHTLALSCSAPRVWTIQASSYGITTRWTPGMAAVMATLARRRHPWPVAGTTARRSGFRSGGLVGLTLNPFRG